MAAAKNKFNANDSFEVLKHLPREINVVLKQSWWENKEEFTANFSHEDKCYRIVVVDDSFELQSPRDNETWQVCLDYTPNGHVIFCSLVTKIAKEGEEATITEKLTDLFGVPEPTNDGIDASDYAMSPDEMERWIVDAFMNEKQ